MEPTRAGHFRRQFSGYEAFVPKPLPPDPPLQWDTGLVGLLSDATVALGRLDGMAGSLPNPDLFVASYVRREAVLSSQIEGTQSSLDDVLAHEVAARVAAPARGPRRDRELCAGHARGTEPAGRAALVGPLDPPAARRTDDGRAGPGAQPRRVPQDPELDRPGRLHAGDGGVRPAVTRRPRRSDPRPSSSSSTTATRLRWCSPGWPTPSSRQSTRSSTATAVSGASSSRCCWSSGECWPGRCCT